MISKETSLLWREILTHLEEGRVEDAYVKAKELNKSLKEGDEVPLDYELVLASILYKITTSRVEFN